MTDFEFAGFPKIPRYKREIVVTEKIDGTNAQIALFELDTQEKLDSAYAHPYLLVLVPGALPGDSPMAMFAGSRNRWIKPGDDNFGFARWAWDHVDELRTLGPGRHFGEWYGAGIQRNYGLTEKRFALFNVVRWNDENPNRPACCDVVPVLARGEEVDLDTVMALLSTAGSRMVPGFMNPEGIVVYHTAARQMYKQTFEQDKGKWSAL